MKTIKAHLKSISPISQGRWYRVEKLNKESSADYEKRTWRERLHTNSEGYVIIPQNMLKNCLANAATYSSRQIPGKGKATYTKHIKAGTLCTEGITLPVKKEDVPGEWIAVPSDGKAGGGKRVEKCFPVIQEWEGDAEFEIYDDTVTPEVFEECLREAGRFVGLGRFRPLNNGYYGRFTVEKFKAIDH